MRTSHDTGAAARALRDDYVARGLATAAPTARHAEQRTGSYMLPSHIVLDATEVSGLLHATVLATPRQPTTITTTVLANDADVLLVPAYGGTWITMGWRPSPDHGDPPLAHGCHLASRLHSIRNAAPNSTPRNRSDFARRRRSTSDSFSLRTSACH